MDCQQAQEEILDSLAEIRPVGTPPSLGAHLSGCAACQNFLDAHLMLDRQLSTVIDAPALSTEFRATLSKRLKHEPLAVWTSFLPDLAHGVGCLAAMVACIVILPLPVGPVLAIGSALALATYFIQTICQSVLESWEEEQS
jgi:hypothetical protein